MIYAWISPYQWLTMASDKDEISVQELCENVMHQLEKLEQKRDATNNIDRVKYTVEGLEVIISYRHREIKNDKPRYFNASLSCSFYQIEHKINAADPRNCPGKYELLPITGLCEDIRFNSKVNLSVRERKVIRNKAEDERLEKEWNRLKA